MVSLILLRLRICEILQQANKEYSLFELISMLKISNPISAADLINRLHFWIDRDPTSRVINANIELTRFQLIESSTEIANRQIVSKLLIDYNIDYASVEVSHAEALTASDNIDGIIQERNDTSSSEMYYITQYDLRKLLAHESSNVALRHYIILLNDLENIYITERLNMLQAIKTECIFKCFGVTMVFTGTDRHPSIHLALHEGSPDYVIKKIKERINGDYRTTKQLAIVRPHYMLIPPIRYAATINKITQDTDSLLKTRIASLIKDYNSDFASEIAEGLITPMRPKLFPVQIRKDHILYQPNTVMSLRDIRNIYLKCIKQQSQVTIMKEPIIQGNAGDSAHISLRSMVATADTFNLD